MNRWGVANDRLNKLYRRLCVTGATCWKAVWCCSHRLPGRDIYILPAVCTPPLLSSCILYTGVKSIEVYTAIIKLARLQYYNKNIYSICVISHDIVQTKLDWKFHLHWNNERECWGKLKIFPSKFLPTVSESKFRNDRNLNDSNIKYIEEEKVQFINVLNVFDENISFCVTF